MKTTASLLLALIAAIAPAKAQLFRPETVNGALLGGIAGAVIGHNSGSLHHNAWQGAAIGSVAGAVIGSAVSDFHDRSGYYVRPSRVGYGYGYGYRPYYGHSYYRGSRYGYGGGWYATPVYRGAYYSRPSYAGTGFWLGGISGAIIGNNSRSHNAWRGSLIGAGAGLLLGSIIDEQNRYAREEVIPVRDPVEPAAPAPAANAPQNVTIINNYYGSSSMSAANGLFGR